MNRISSFSVFGWGTMLFCFIPQNKRRYRPLCSGSGLMASFSLLPRETLMQELISSQF